MMNEKNNLICREYKVKNPNWSILKTKYNISSVQEFIDLLNKTNANSPVRTSYQLCDKSREKNLIDYKTKRTFLAPVGDERRIVPENAIKFHLVENHNETLGDIFAYEVPYLQTNANGGIDLVSYNGKLNFIELKNCAMKGLGSRISNESTESLLKAVIEIATYYSYIYNFSVSEFEVFKKQLKDKYTKVTKKEIEFSTKDIILCVLVSKKTYEEEFRKNKELFTEIMNLKNFKFYYIEQINNVESIIDVAYLGTKEKLFNIQEYKIN